MPCYQTRVYTNKLITDKDSTVDRKALETGAANTGLKLEATSVTGNTAIIDRATGRHIAYLEGNTLTMRDGSAESREELTNRIRQAYSVGVLVNEASKQYWSPTVVKEGNNYKVLTEVNY